MIVNKKQLSDIFGITERTWTEWQRDPDFPVIAMGLRGVSNQYDTQAVYQYMVERAVKGARHESAKERLDRVRADRELLAYARDVQELVPAEEITAVFSQVVSAIKNTLVNGANKLKTEIDALYDIDIDPDILDEHNRSVLCHLSAIEVESDSGGAADTPAIQTATETVNG